MFTTLDGFIAGPKGEFLDYEPSAEEIEFANEVFGAADAVIFGRLTYEGFVSYWDTLDLADPAVSAWDVQFARIFRKLDRVVFSRTLPDIGGATTVVRDAIAATIGTLKEQPGRDLLLICGPDLLATLMQLDLVDQFRLLVRPTAIRRGRALFGEIQGELDLKLLSLKTFQSGVVMHHYQKA